MSIPSSTDLGLPAVAHDRWAPLRVRLDDVEGDRGYEFEGPVHTWTAGDTGEVVQALAAAEAAAQAGQWVVGFVCYEAAHTFDEAFPIAEPSPLLPLAWFTAFERRREVPVVAPLAEPPPRGALVDDIHRAHGGAWFCAGVESIRRLIEIGGVYQVNLTDRVRGRLDADPFDLYRSMVSAQGGSFNAFLDLGEVVVASASPELFLEIDCDTVTTRPMKGTRRRHGRADRDREVAEELRTSDKDLAENVMIVDLLRNDLSRVSLPGGVSVPDLFRIERYGTVWQLTSTVTATLRPDVGLADIFRATFPCGSITGAPKVAAMRTIRCIEPSPRGLYCGAIGMIAPARPGARPASTWSVAIRTAVVNTADGTVEFGAGGGITYDSVAADEDDELESKTAVLRAPRSAFELFETLRLDEHGVHELARHLRRLADSAEYFGFPCDPVGIAHAVAALRPPKSPQRLRIVLDRCGRAALDTAPLNVMPLDSSQHGTASMPVRLAVAPLRVRSDDPFLCHKTTRRSVYEQARVMRPDADDVLLVNERDEILETTIANVLYRLGSLWYTPPLASGGLPGIGREVLLEAGAVTERTLPLRELHDCDEIAVVNSLRGRRPAELIDK